MLLLSADLSPGSSQLCRVSAGGHRRGAGSISCCPACVLSREGPVEVWRPPLCSGGQKVPPVGWKQAFDQQNTPWAGLVLLWMLAEKEVLDGQLEIQPVDPASFVPECRTALQCCPHHPACVAHPWASHISLPQQPASCPQRHLVRLRVSLRPPRDPTAPTLAAALQDVGMVGKGGTTLVATGQAGAGLGAGEETRPTAWGMRGGIWE